MSEPLRVILASQSPRRSQLLSLIGMAHEVMPADIDESYGDGEVPLAHAERLAREKGRTIAARAPDALIISADTIVVIDGIVLGKPTDEADAAAMLERLSGRTHTVFTAVAVLRVGAIESGVEAVTVTFRALDAAAIAEYIATREPMDKAGSYGIQGYGATIVERIDGDYFAVMGLALGRMVELMARVGVRYRFGTLDVTAD
ncbi:MAG: Maf family protein [Gemmatimonadota bacterium]|nr:Maf family protein [Gemmatimonadota bacterium]